ncbi:YxiF family protein [Peribacillus muralis]|uniref:YxiF family protein n=1 Tax=Peribacillus muralis TaxID=264697 RepID=UPI003D055BA3
MRKDAKAKMEYLKRKNRRNYLIKEISNFTNVTIESLMDMEKNDDFCQSVFRWLSNLNCNIIIKGENDQENIRCSIQLLKDILPQFICKKTGRMLFDTGEELEAIKVNFDDVNSILEDILVFTKFTTGYGDFILVDDQLKFGICIERTEYHYELFIWGMTTN